MTDNDPARAAQANLERLADNAYPGRGIVIGRSDGGFLAQVFWIMGRSANSRNRVLVAQDGRVRTEAADASAMTDPSLVLYTALDSLRGCHVASNGDHTDRIVEALRARRDFRGAMWGQDYEPDPPHFTPRIAGVTEVAAGGAGGWLAIVKRSPLDESSARFSYDFEELAPGYGWGLHTYAGPGDPLPSFAGDPLLLPLLGDEAAIAARYWEALNADNRVALAVKRIPEDGTPPRIVLHNRHGGG